MRKEQKEKIVKEAREFIGDGVDGRCRVQDDAKVLQAPDAYWVQAWISVSLSAGKS